MPKFKIDKSFENHLESELNMIGLSLVELRKFQTGSTQTIRVTINDPKRPVGHDQCSIASRLIHSIEPTIREAYNLEIWSPGVERELKTDREFNVFKGQEIIVSFKSKEEKDQLATLINKQDGCVIVSINDEETSIDLSEIQCIRVAPQKPDTQEPIEISLEDI
ncbi:MAG: hypothetical protein QNJ31_01885 [Candidatus Caenarcaniphilales bacterium]|nr:hypothetical protein [Candidatus Caenarcaniphilales bacterium]